MTLNDAIIILAMAVFSVGLGISISIEQVAKAIRETKKERK